MTSLRLFLVNHRLQGQIVSGLLLSLPIVTTSLAATAATNDTQVLLPTLNVNETAPESDVPSDSHITNANEITNNSINHNATDSQQIITDSNRQLTNFADSSNSTVHGVTLQTLVDPTSQMVITDTYSLDVPSTLSLSQAQNVLTQVSPKIAANNAAIAAKELQSQAADSLNQPIVLLNASATHYDINRDIDLTPLKSKINQGVEQVGQNLGLDALAPYIDSSTFIDNHIPDNYEFHREGNSHRAGISVLWPVYTAGRTQAINGLLDARTQEQQADALMDSNELYTTLIDRYFNAQLAIIAAYLREDALRTIKDTDHLAQRLLEEGFISEVERLEAKSALAEAKSEAIKARNTAQLAMTALQRLLRTPKPIKPTTPLFVNSKPLPDLSYFQNLALQNHPGLKKVDAKYNQASQLKAFSDTGYKPNISVFGYHEISKNPSWIAGVSASWKLWGGLDKNAQLAASDASLRQAQLTKLDVSDNILLLVEKNWQAVDNARIQFLALGSNEQLFQELLRLKQRGLEEGINTANDVAQAQTKYLKARTERAAAANDYVQALAALMQSCGTPLAFDEYMSQADIHLPQLY
ncbi:TolC family protein [Psychrobacter sp. I-STPA10]|uniref:TolC family protein n=1 Tax=Psychrobacter sp. I-STPA10 TaxID=2585769 RepID=UPI001E2CDD7D|nr:TolC family protein [Psychrobacter sp. I-STPA10]